jgi:hypothetical protein
VLVIASCDHELLPARALQEYELKKDCFGATLKPVAAA